MRDNYYRLGEGFLIVYSITMKDTFVATQRFYDHILQVKGKDEVIYFSQFLEETMNNLIQYKVPLILVGSKCDLDTSREVQKSEGQDLAAKWNCPFFETSAKTRTNVDEVFTELVRIVKASKKKVEPEVQTSSGGCCVIL